MMTNRPDTAIERRFRVYKEAPGFRPGPRDILLHPVTARDMASVIRWV